MHINIANVFCIRRDNTNNSNRFTDTNQKWHNVMLNNYEYKLWPSHVIVHILYWRWPFPVIDKWAVIYFILLYLCIYVPMREHIDTISYIQSFLKIPKTTFRHNTFFQNIPAYFSIYYYVNLNFNTQKNVTSFILIIYILFGC